MREYVCRQMCYDFERRWRVGDILETDGVLEHLHFIDLPKRLTAREALIEADVITRDDHLGKTKRIYVSQSGLLVRTTVAPEPRKTPDVPMTMREAADAGARQATAAKRGRGRPPKSQQPVDSSA